MPWITRVGVGGIERKGKGSAQEVGMEGWLVRTRSECHAMNKVCEQAHCSPDATT